MALTEWVILLVLVVFGVMVVQNLRSIDRHLLDMKRMMYREARRPLDDSNSV